MVLSDVALVTYRGLRDKVQGRSRANILKSSSDYSEVCGSVAIFTWVVVGRREMCVCVLLAPGDYSQLPGAEIQAVREELLGG